MTAPRRSGTISQLNEIHSLLSASEKRRLLLILCLMLITTVFEVVGVGSIFPLLQALSTPEEFTQGHVGAFLKDIGVTSTTGISLILTAVFAVFLVLSNLLTVLDMSESAKFAWANWRNVAMAALRHYLERPYESFLNRNSVDLTKSGGQRQRLGIARALYAEPSIVVFDEATSALDDETEAAVIDTISRFDSKTIVIAAHRLSTLRKCDAVYEVKDGRLAYVGPGEAVARYRGSR